MASSLLRRTAFCIYEALIMLCVLLMLVALMLGIALGFPDLPSSSHDYATQRLTVGGESYYWSTLEMDGHLWVVFCSSRYNHAHLAHHPECTRCLQRRATAVPAFVEQPENPLVPEPAPQP